MLKRLFGGKPENTKTHSVNTPIDINEPAPDQRTLKAIRERLQPLRFEETSDPKYVDNVFQRGDFLFRWGFNYKDESYFFYLSEQKGKNESIEGPSMWNKDENAWNEFNDKILKTLDHWLKTI
jgi:hypothetical protein